MDGDGVNTYHWHTLYRDCDNNMVYGYIPDFDYVEITMSGIRMDGGYVGFMRSTWKRWGYVSIMYVDGVGRMYVYHENF